MVKKANIIPAKHQHITILTLAVLSTTVPVYDLFYPPHLVSLDCNVIGCHSL